MILGCGETTTLMLLLWCNIHGVNSTHHCHYTMALADSKFDDLSDADIDSLTKMQFLKTPGRAANFNFSFKIVEVFLSTVLPALCSAFNLNNKNVNALIACKLWGFTCTRSLTMNLNFQYRTRLVRY